jgi:hypothetical protein
MEKDRRGEWKISTHTHGYLPRWSVCARFESTKAHQMINRWSDHSVAWRTLSHFSFYSKLFAPVQRRAVACANLRCRDPLEWARARGAYAWWRIRQPRAVSITARERERNRRVERANVFCDPIVEDFDEREEELTWMSIRCTQRWELNGPFIKFLDHAQFLTKTPIVTRWRFTPANTMFKPALHFPLELSNYRRRADVSETISTVTSRCQKRFW